MVVTSWHIAIALYLLGPAYLVTSDSFNKLADPIIDFSKNGLKELLMAFIAICVMWMFWFVFLFADMATGDQTI